MDEDFLTWREARGHRLDTTRRTPRMASPCVFTYVAWWWEPWHSSASASCLLLVHSVTVVSVYDYYYRAWAWGLDVFACAYSDGKNSIWKQNKMRREGRKEEHGAPRRRSRWRWAQRGAASIRPPSTHHRNSILSARKWPLCYDMGWFDESAIDELGQYPVHMAINSPSLYFSFTAASLNETCPSRPCFCSQKQGSKG